MLVGSVVEPQAGDDAFLTLAKKVPDDPGIDAASVSDRKDGVAECRASVRSIVSVEYVAIACQFCVAFLDHR